MPSLVGSEMCIRDRSIPDEVTLSPFTDDTPALALPDQLISAAATPADIVRAVVARRTCFAALETFST